MTQTAVALVDHQPVLCESLSALLSDETDIRIVGAASTPSEVANLIATGLPDVLVLDAEFHGSEGIDLLDQFRAIPSSPAVVMLMRDDDRSTAVTALRRGASGFVLKMAPIRELVEAIRWAAKGQMWMSPPLLTSFLAERSDDTQAEAQRRLAELTKREAEVLNLMVDGLGYSAIARRLHVSVNTARTHSQNLQKKLGVHSALAAVSVALDAGSRPAA